jgi:hypothetical protein
MPLTRGRIVGYDDERLAFGFTMLSDGETVECQISDAAMDELAGVRVRQAPRGSRSFRSSATLSSELRPIAIGTAAGRRASQDDQSTIVEGQVLGGIAQGIGGALYEHFD